jgi:site-specific recombinase
MGLELTEKMIVASPFLIGLLSYALLSAFAGAVVLWEAVCQGVSRMLPAAARYRLEDLLAPPTFSNVERMLEPRPEHRLLSFFSGAWFVLVALMMFGGSLGALVHTAYLLFDPRLDISRELAVLSTALGATAWIRGMILFASALGATGGFNLGHHRGSARNRAGEGIT